MSETTRPTSLWQRFALSLDDGRTGVTKSPWFTMNVVVELTGPLDVRVLSDAFDDLLRRHDILRTRLDDDGPEPVQVISSRATSIEAVDEQEVLSTTGWTHAPVEYGDLSPVRLRLARRSHDEHVFSVHVHHMMADPVTMWNVLSELAALYSARLCGEPAPPAPAAQYWEYAMAEAAGIRDGRAQAERWWDGVLGGVRVCSVAQSAAGPPFAYREQIMSAKELSAVERLSRANRTTVFSLLAAGLACGMAPYLDSGATLLFSTIFSRRNRPEWRRMIGPCIVPSYLAIPRPADRLSREYADSVRDSMIGCHRNSLVPTKEVASMNSFFGRERTDLPFFEYIPQAWPVDLEFGPTRGRVVNAAGSRDTGRARYLGLRARKTNDGVLAGHVSGDGIGWTESSTRDAYRAMAGQLMAFGGVDDLSPAGPPPR